MFCGNTSVWALSKGKMSLIYCVSRQSGLHENEIDLRIWELAENFFVFWIIISTDIWEQGGLEGWGDSPKIIQVFDWNPRLSLCRTQSLIPENLELTWAL